MEFSTSDISNFEYFAAINNKIDCGPTLNIYNYIFIPVCLYRPSDMWDNSRELESTIQKWLRSRENILILSINTMLAFGEENVKIVLLFDPLFKSDKGLWEISKSLLSINAEKLEALYIDCRKASKLSLSEMYKTTVASDIRSYLQQKQHGHDDILLLNRVDNDDLFSTSYIWILKTLSKLYKIKSLIKKEILFDFPLGIQYDVDNKKSYATFWPENNFASILTSSILLKDNNSVVPFSYPHDNPPEKVKKVTVSTLHPQWIQCIHKNNVANSIFEWSYTYQEEVSISMLLKILRSKSSK